jgi:prepilin-type N-terminal cleavage/methylation domain-containing protein
MPNRRGFTLVELLIIIGIIGILFAVILIAVDPDKRFDESRDAVRRQDVRDILEAIVEYTTDNRGNFPTNLDNVPGSIQLLGTATGGCGNSNCAAYIATTTANNVFSTSCADLSGSLVETYLSSIPFDPTTGSEANTRYWVNKTAGNRVEVGACDTERATATISVKR